MKKIIFFSLLLFIRPLDATTWHEILLEKVVMLQHADFNLIKEHYKHFIDKTVPTIADARIKSIAIIENGESLVDISLMNNSRITMLPNPPENKPFYDAAFNSGLPRASKIRKSVYLKLEKMIYFLDAFAELFGYKPGEISIKVFEGLRDLKTQEKLFQSKYEEIQLKNSLWNHEEIERETAKWVSPVKNNVPVHSTGAAIDIRLWNETTHEFLDLGKFGVIWGENKAAQTFSEDISDLQKLNRLYLLMAAAKAELINYPYEYWHFSSGDRYALYWQNDAAQKVAQYGAIE